MTPDTVSTPSRHTWYEDIFAILIGTSLVSLGIAFYTPVTLITGSTAGLALLLQYGTGISFGILFFAINLPFYVLAVLRIGLALCHQDLRFSAAVSYFSAMLPHWWMSPKSSPSMAACIGGGLIGLGILSLFRHKGQCWRHQYPVRCSFRKISASAPAMSAWHRRFDP